MAGGGNFDKPIAAVKEMVRWMKLLYDNFVLLFEYVRNSPIGKLLGAINPRFFREKFLDFITPSSAQAATNGEGDTTASSGQPSQTGKPGIVQRGMNAVKRALGLGGNGADKTQIGPVPAGLLDNIARTEGTYRTGYNTSLGHGRYLPGGKEQDLTSQTLAQILQLGRHMRSQPGNPNSSALGRYQIVGSTLEEAAKALGMDLNTQKFDAETQDRMAHWIARRQRLGAWEGFKTHPAERAAAAAALARKDQSGGTRQATPIIVAPKLQAGQAIPTLRPNAAGIGPGAFNVDNYLRSQPMGSSSTTNDNSRSVSQNNPVTVNINGASDPQATASAVTRGVGQAHDMSLRNVQTAIR